MNDYEAAVARYEYTPTTGELLSKRSRKAVLKNGMVNGKQRRPYQIAFLLMEGYIPDTIDHRDGVRSNNCWSNLRAATRGEQSANTRKAGVRCWPTGKWYYQLCVDGVRYYKSNFATRDAAETAFDLLCEELQGEFSTQHSRSNKKEDE